MKNVSRRQFLASSGVFVGSCVLTSGGGYCDYFKSGVSNSGSIKGAVFKNDAPSKLWKWHKEVVYYDRMENLGVVCRTCPNACSMAPGDRSICRSKVNIKGKLYTLAYGNPCSVNVDPVEKKPLFHYKPGSRIFSIATAGCNFRCLNCQNWQISQSKPDELRNYDLFPDKVVESALKYNSQGIAYTYSEPSTYYEYMADTAKIAKKAGLGNLWISNGYLSREPLEKLCTLIDGANVNLKSFSDDIYKKLNGGTLNPVLETFKTLNEKKVHFEMTNLVVPGYTDDETMVKKMCKWILDTLGPDHPLHFSRFFPKYRLKRLVPTPISLLTKFRKIAIDTGLRYVYVGNVAKHEGNHTYCHSCSRMIIRRNGFHIDENNIVGSQCKFCHTLIPGIW